MALVEEAAKKKLALEQKRWFAEGYLFFLEKSGVTMPDTKKTALKYAFVSVPNILMDLPPPKVSADDVENY